MNGARVPPSAAPRSFPRVPETTCGSAAELPPLAQEGAGGGTTPPGGLRMETEPCTEPRVMSESRARRPQQSCQAAALARGTRLQSKSDSPCAALG